MSKTLLISTLLLGTIVTMVGFAIRLTKMVYWPEAIIIDDYLSISIFFLFSVVFLILFIAELIELKK